MPIRSAGILLYRMRGNHKEVFLIHPGGPYWSQKDTGAWSIPKGIVSLQESPLATARREFREETGTSVRGPAVLLGSFRQPSGKQLIAWAVEGDLDPANLSSNSFAMIWPPRSGQVRHFPEVDRGAWFRRAQATVRILKGQLPVLDAFFRKSPQPKAQKLPSRGKAQGMRCPRL